MKKISIIIYIFLASLAACNNSTDKVSEVDKVENDQTGETQEEESNTVSITEQQAEVIGLELGKIEQKSLGNNISVTGRLDLFPQDQARISPFIGGNVKAVYFIEGDKVRKGQTLALLEHPDYIQLQQELQQLTSQLSYLEQEYIRKKKLYEEEVSSGREFQLAKSEFLSAKSAVKGLKLKLKLLGLDVDKVVNGEIFSTIPIITPIDGYVKDVRISLGDFIEPQFDMFEITNNSLVHVDFRVYEKDIYKVTKGQKAYFTVANKPGRLLEAKIHSVGQTFEDNPKSVHIHAYIVNPPEGLLPGMYVEGRIVESEKLTDVVPEDAILTEGGKSYVFVKAEAEDHNEDENSDDEEAHKELVFRKVAVITGVRDAGFVEINVSPPLPENTLVVFKGAYTLSSEMIKGELEHGH